jgi:putative ABC transport system permease protein
MSQILIEAILLASVGGALGVGLGAIATLVLSRVFDLTLHITVGYVTLALVVSGLVGVISGWYPAARASKLDPVEALRAE